MRLGVLDIGSNTGHLLVVDAHGGAAPLPAYSFKQPLRLAEHLDDDGAVTKKGIDALSTFCAESVVVAEDRGCEEMLGFATSAVRDASNSYAVLTTVHDRTGVDLSVLTGEDEARLTFLAVRRWFGWSAGRLAVFDIGGGSLEIAGGSDEAPDVAWSVPLGAARMAREFFADGTPGEEEVRALRKKIRATIARDAGHLLRAGRPDRAVATSKTFRSLARITGAAPYAEGQLVPRVLGRADLTKRIPKLMAMSPQELMKQPGVSTDRGHQVVPGALVAEACMDIFDLEELEICPWALREGLILERFDHLGHPTTVSAPLVALSTASVYPESTAHGFGYAASLGFDAVEVMVGMDALSQQVSAVKQLSEHHEMPVCAVHAPCLLFTARVWGTEPWGKLERSAEMATAVGADVVVVHPPFRWQRDYARDFVAGIAALEARTGVAFAIENMYPWRASGKRGLDRGMDMYLPGWDPSTEDYAHTTVDLSHAATAGSDVVEMAIRLGPRLRHVHLTDGSGSAKDEHLVPGRGVMDAAGFLRHLTAQSFAGHVVLEINTRRVASREERTADLAESLAFARQHLGLPAGR